MYKITAKLSGDVSIIGVFPVESMKYIFKARVRTVASELGLSILGYEEGKEKENETDFCKRKL